ncbi:MAG: hypothetical protein FWE32_06590 [Oscillospiraceae bacterium]|nr:hypothetical protein [Oscillospiraceae bacterium]
MAEKPRLKETDEIFSSVGKGSVRAKAPAEQEPERQQQSQPDRGGREAGEQPDKAPLIESLFDLDQPQAGRASRRAARGRGKKGASDIEPKVDRRPLNFGKYGLGSDNDKEDEGQSPPKKTKAPAAKPAPEPAPAPVTPPEPPPEPPPPPPPEPAMAMAAAEEEERRSRPRRRAGEPASAPQIRRVSPPANPEPEAPAPDIQTRPAAPADPPPSYHFEEEIGPVIQPFVFEDFEEPAPPPPPPPAEKPREPKVVRAVKPEPPKKQEEPEPPPVMEAPEIPPEEQPKKRSKPPTAGRNPERERDQILQELSSQFDEAFSQAFEGGAKEVTKQEKRGRPIRGKGVAKASAPVDLIDDTPPPPPPPAEIEDPQADLEADSFLREFAEQIQEEEDTRTELFKDTLAEKFERERARYLKELGIEDGPQVDEEPKTFTPPAVRRLDLQIEPEMHVSADDAPPKPVERPVTYSRMGQVRPQAPAGEALSPAQPKVTQKPKAKAAAARNEKKSTEELLIELAFQKTEASLNAGSRPPPRPMEGVPVKIEAPPPEPVIFEPEPQVSFWKQYRNIILISSAAAMFLLIPLIVLIVSMIRPNEGIELLPPVEIGESEQVAGTLQANQSHNFETREVFENIYIRRPDISIRNATVNSILLIEGIASPGEIRLEDIDVGGAIHLSTGEVDRLVLHNVQTPRLVIHNDEHFTSAVTVSGNTAIDTVEVRTNATINRQPMHGADGGQGVQNILLSAAPSVSSMLTVNLNGLELPSLQSSSDAVIGVGDGTRIERMTSEGAISISGNGRISHFSAGPRGPGDGTILRLEMGVTHLAIRGPGDLIVHSEIDSVTASDHLTISGSGNIASLMLNQPMAPGRLQVGIYGSVRVNALVANAEALLRVSEQGMINHLTANQSVYALGNPVNRLVVNANDVIYENEPNGIDVTSGIRPPETVAANPNLDLTLHTNQVSAPPDTAADDISTVCGHTRESGGFLEGDGSASNPFRVSTPAQLAHIQLHLSSHFVQTADIDVGADTQFITGFNMIAGQGEPFTGSFDGQGFAIRNLRITSDAQAVGLFAENSGRIENVSLVSGEIRSTAAGQAYVGGIVGRNHAQGDVFAVSNGARIIGGNSAYVGGIVGYNNGRVRDSYNAALITGADHTGGLIGTNGVSGALSSSYNVGNVEGTGDGVGSIVGVNRGVVANTHFLLETAWNGIGVGDGTANEQTSEAMASAQMVADLSVGDVNSPWVRSEGGGFVYPVLRVPVRR